MAITNAQQAKQLLALGGRTGFQGGGRDASQSDFGGNTASDTGPGGGATETGPGFTGDSIFGGPPSDGGGDRIIDIANRQRRQQLRDLATKAAEDKMEEGLERFRDLGSRSRNFMATLQKFSPLANIASRFGPLNNRDFFTDKVLGSRNFRGLTKEQFAQLSPEEQEKEFDEYMSDRMSGKTW